MHAGGEGGLGGRATGGNDAAVERVLAQRLGDLQPAVGPREMLVLYVVNDGQLYIPLVQAKGFHQSLRRRARQTAQGRQGHAVVPGLIQQGRERTADPSDPAR